jgi:hypothetical protein
MPLDARCIALGGLGYGPLALVLDGFISIPAHAHVETPAGGGWAWVPLRPAVLPRLGAYLDVEPVEYVLVGQDLHDFLDHGLRPGAQILTEQEFNEQPRDAVRRAPIDRAGWRTLTARGCTELFVCDVERGRSRRCRPTHVGSPP